MLASAEKKSAVRDGGVRGRRMPLPVTGVGRGGELRLTVQGKRWRTRYRAPLFVNVLPAADGTLPALPVDQGGGLRNRKRQLQRVPASRLAGPGGTLE